MRPEELSLPFEVVECFENFQKARTNFVSEMNLLADIPKNIPKMKNAQVLDHLTALLNDVVPSIKNGAAMVLGKLAASSQEIAKEIGNENMIHTLNSLIQEDTSKNHKIAILTLLRSICKESPDLAKTMIEDTLGDFIIATLEDKDTRVRESSVWCIDFIGKLEEPLAQYLVDHNVVVPLLKNVQDSDLALKCVSILCLSDLAKHSKNVAERIVNQNGIEIISPLLSNENITVKTQVCNFNSQVGKHQESWAKAIMEKGKMFPQIMDYLEYPDINLRNNATICLHVMARHSIEIAKSIISQGAIHKVVKNVEKMEKFLVPASLTFLSVVSHFSALNADSIIEKGITPLLLKILKNSEKMEAKLNNLNNTKYLSNLHTSKKNANSIINLNSSSKEVLETKKEEQIEKITACMLIRELSHSFKQVEPFLKAGIVDVLLFEMRNPEGNAEAYKTKISEALVSIVKNLSEFSDLKEFFFDVETGLLVETLLRASKILQKDADQKKIFIQDGHLATIQKLLHDRQEKEVRDACRSINRLFPDKAIKFYSPNFETELLKYVQG